MKEFITDALRMWDDGLNGHKDWTKGHLNVKFLERGSFSLLSETSWPKRCKKNSDMTIILSAGPEEHSKLLVDMA